MKLSEISDRIEKARTGANIWENVKLLTVSKNVDTNAVENLFSQGQMDFGENRVQELKRKCEILVDLPLKWHFIGTLQKNKINQLITLKPVLWQSCNSFELAVAVDKRLDYRLDTLLEINVANEDSKSGISADEAIDTYRKIKAECKNLNLVGVMSIGAHSDDLKEIIKSFELTYKIFENLQKSGAAICSMGMSADFETAIKCGSNMVRLGRILYA